MLFGPSVLLLPRRRLRARVNAHASLTPRQVHITELRSPRMMLRFVLLFVLIGVCYGVCDVLVVCGPGVEEAQFKQWNKKLQSKNKLITLNSPGELTEPLRPTVQVLATVSSLSRARRLNSSPNWPTISTNTSHSSDWNQTVSTEQHSPLI